jgi:hypothetical protein
MYICNDGRDKVISNAEPKLPPSKSKSKGKGS